MHRRTVSERRYFDIVWLSFGTSAQTTCCRRDRCNIASHRITSSTDRRGLRKHTQKKQKQSIFRSQSNVQNTLSTYQTDIRQHLWTDMRLARRAEYSRSVSGAADGGRLHVVVRYMWCAMQRYVVEYVFASTRNASTLRWQRERDRDSISEQSCNKE